MISSVLWVPTRCFVGGEPIFMRSEGMFYWPSEEWMMESGLFSSLYIARYYSPTENGIERGKGEKKELIIGKYYCDSNGDAFEKIGSVLCEAVRRPRRPGFVHHTQVGFLFTVADAFFCMKFYCIPRWLISV